MNRHCVSFAPGYRAGACQVIASCLLLATAMFVPAVAQDRAGDYTESIVGDFEFNGNANDTSGREASVQLKNSAFVDYSLYLNGGRRDTDQAYSAHINTPGLTYDEFTIAIRFIARSIDGKSGHVLSGGTSTPWFELSRAESGKLMVSLNDGKFQYEVEGASLEANRWYALICGVSVPEAKVRMYLNGNVVGETDLPKGFRFDVAENDKAGKDKQWSFSSPKTGASFDGWVDDLIFFGQMLSVDDMSDIPLRHNENLGQGENSLQENKTGNSNTAVGVNAMQFNTTGGSNTSLGTWALRRNTTGSWNSAVGDNSLPNNSAGEFNSAFGARSLFTNQTGKSNTGAGAFVLQKNTTGSQNSAMGVEALRDNIEGVYNSALGFQALLSNQTGKSNTAAGANALMNNTTGSWNVAVGLQSSKGNTTGISNTAIGTESFIGNTTGSYNIAIGVTAGDQLTTGSHNIVIANKGQADEEKTIRIGTSENQTRAFLAGVAGVTTGADDGVPVMIDSAGQLGTISSSRRFKEDIRDLSEAETQERLQNLRPVTFRYKKAFSDGGKPVQFGLIAEEVAELFPELVVFNKDGQPETVKYHLLTPLLLRQVQQQQEQLVQKERQLQQLEQRLSKLEAATSSGE